MTLTEAASGGPVAVDQVLGLATAYIAARGLHAVAEAGIAAALGDDAMTTQSLARAAGVDTDALERLLRVLATHGIFSRDEHGRWAHTESSRLLRDDHPRSLRAFVRMLGGPSTWGSLTALEDTLRTGQTASHALHPDGFWAHLQSHPDQLSIFDDAMTGRAHEDVTAVLTAYDFSRHRRIADIGGGRGHLIAAILDAHPDVEGVLFDLPQVVAHITPVPRLTLVSGDFFADPLPACEAYILMQVIHDWSDEEAVAILSAVASAATPEDRTVLLLEWLYPEDDRPHPATSMDVMMLATTGGRERTVAQYRALLQEAGIDLIAIHPTPGPLVVLEGRVGERRRTAGARI